MRCQLQRAAPAKSGSAEMPQFWVRQSRGQEILCELWQHDISTSTIKCVGEREKRVVENGLMRQPSGRRMAERFSSIQAHHKKRSKVRGFADQEPVLITASGCSLPCPHRLQRAPRAHASNPYLACTQHRC